MTSGEVIDIIVKSAADVAGVTAFAKTPTEAVSSGEVTEAVVKSAARRGLLFADGRLILELWAVVK